MGACYSSRRTASHLNATSQPPTINGSHHSFLPGIRNNCVHCKSESSLVVVSPTKSSKIVKLSREQLDYITASVEALNSGELGVSKHPLAQNNHSKKIVNTDSNSSRLNESKSKRRRQKKDSEKRSERRSKRLKERITCGTGSSSSSTTSSPYSPPQTFVPTHHHIITPQREFIHPDQIESTIELPNGQIVSFLHTERIQLPGAISFAQPVTVVISSSSSTSSLASLDSGTLTNRSSDSSSSSENSVINMSGSSRVPAPGRGSRLPVPSSLSRDRQIHSSLPSVSPTHKSTTSSSNLQRAGLSRQNASASSSSDTLNNNSSHLQKTLAPAKSMPSTAQRKAVSSSTTGSSHPDVNGNANEASSLPVSSKLTTQFSGLPKPQTAQLIKPPKNSQGSMITTQTHSSNLQRALIPGSASGTAMGTRSRAIPYQASLVSTNTPKSSAHSVAHVAPHQSTTTAAHPYSRPVRIPGLGGGGIPTPFSRTGQTSIPSRNQASMNQNLSQYNQFEIMRDKRSVSPRSSNSSMPSSLTDSEDNSYGRDSKKTSPSPQIEELTNKVESMRLGERSNSALSNASASTSFQYQPKLVYKPLTKAARRPVLKSFISASSHPNQNDPGVMEETQNKEQGAEYSHRNDKDISPENESSEHDSLIGSKIEDTNKDTSSMSSSSTLTSPCHQPSSLKSDPDFLIDDEISDQPQLMLGTNASQEEGESKSKQKEDQTQANIIKRSLGEFQALKSKSGAAGDTASISSSIVSLNSNPSTPTNKPSPIKPRFRPPRSFSMIESADGTKGLDSPSVRAALQDIKGIKTQLLQLQSLLQQVSLRQWAKMTGHSSSCIYLFDRLRLLMCSIPSHFKHHPLFTLMTGSMKMMIPTQINPKINC